MDWNWKEAHSHKQETACPIFGSLLLKPEAHGIFVTEMPATEEQARFYEASWKGIAKRNHCRVPAKLLGQARDREVKSFREVQVF